MTEEVQQQAAQPQDRGTPPTQENQPKNAGVVKLEMGQDNTKQEDVKLPSEGGGNPDELARPDYLLPKFKNLEEQAKAYPELEKKLGQRQTAAEPNKETAKQDSKAPAADLKITEQSKAKEALANKGLDITKYEAEFMANGKLSEESYAELEKGGWTRQLADNYIEGQKALADNIRNDVFSKAGINSEAFDKIKAWAVDSLAPEELAVFDEGLKGSQAMQIKTLKEVATRFSQNDPKLISGGTAGASESDVYSSTEEMKEDQKDPRYEKSEVFRNKVIAKVARSLQRGKLK